MGIHEHREDAPPSRGLPAEFRVPLAAAGVLPQDFRPLFPVYIAGVIMWPVALGVIITSHQS